MLTCGQRAMRDERASNLRLSSSGYPVEGRVIRLTSDSSCKKKNRMAGRSTLITSALMRYRTLVEIQADLPALIRDKCPFQLRLGVQSFEELSIDQRQLLVGGWIWQEEKAVEFSSATGKCQKLNAARQYLFRLDSQERTRGLIRLTFDQPAEIVWPLFLEHWSGCDDTYFWRSLVRKILDRAAAERSPLEYYDYRTRERMAGLPKLVPVWRGCTKGREAGLSWTLNRKVAQQFAYGLRHRNPQPTLMRARIRKNRILALFLDRQEQEVLCSVRRHSIEPHAATELSSVFA